MERLTNEKNDAIRAEARQKALEEAREHGLQVGTTVGFYDLRDRMSYELLEIIGDTAIIGYENERDGKVRIEAPLQDLVDVNRVLNIASEIMATRSSIRPEQWN
ncbi:hypothetical protein A2533_04720 [Candidatus Falkowbacteria bacterium RIFOXYD2_FULL_35_9]|uniref:Uncharacterized protein n=1 Tax=Candidatus Falkowbacteria bacterium RIFOXYC2_FULL_36_12 TaxID=1798002 RepID=A0A1F5T352_9BACT|nr:MAG: hypothetical protein A2300_04240 [Candidatus Falkowbacteria bacterium RIFOXYB2_FULL_35_7]OGF33036.1 MAG: hypothetical protein A2223_04030 [Candidatus Falkowbacteria bacterium RIFOXYA2_FULL_35_8]OGF33395.1 MAG: hypothetical protein A2478_01695 [Candidatus Falkowbacteria bacterium RIFOXYC2_FULL_36_12]OGF46076.1 MAG: hypothetical protein A2533_04720 [Candidatus Falkowbacteria bacterium RIFOXYD2_FULL_35_9]